MKSCSSERITNSCTSCGKVFASGYQPFCDQCGAMTDVQYDLNQVALNRSKNPYVRFADLLPIHNPETLLPQKGKYTPVIHATGLGAYLNLPKLFLKNETVSVTGSTKDRMAAVSLAYLWERGVKDFCTSSTGNSSSSYAYQIKQFPGMHLYLFTAEKFLRRVSHAKHSQVTHFAMKEASFVEAFDYAGEYARKHNFTSERGFFNVGRREGLKLAMFEAMEQVPHEIDWYVQAVSSAMGVYGAYKGAIEFYNLGLIERKPKLLCVQQESCAPLVNAFNENVAEIAGRHIVDNPTGIAEAVLRGNPTRAYPHIRKIVLESQGKMIKVSESEIREARKMLEEYEGISACYSASAAMAGVVRLAKKGAFSKNELILINLTGKDRKPADNQKSVIWLTRQGEEWITI